MFRRQSRDGPRLRECKECRQSIAIGQEVVFRTTCCSERLCKKCGTFRRCATTVVLGEHCCHPPSYSLRNPPVMQEPINRVREIESSQETWKTCINCSSQLYCESELTYFTACCLSLLCDQCAEFMWFAETACNCCVCNRISMQKPVLGCHLTQDRSDEVQSYMDLSTVDIGVNELQH
jgi:hypothetical protein